MSRKKTPLRRLRHRLTGPVVKLVILCCSVTPGALRRLFAKSAGFILSLFPLSAGRIIEGHRRTVMADNGIKARTASIYASVILSYLDFFYLSKHNDKAFRKAVKVQGAENMASALEHGKGAIAVTAHFSAWELIPRAVKLLGFRTGVVGRSLTHSGASSVLEELRAAPGVDVVDRDSGVGPIVRLFRNNTAVGILIDQDTSRVQSEYADFLGIPALTPVAPAILASKLGIPVVTLHILRQKDHTYLLSIDPPLFFEKNDTSTSSSILTLLNQRIGEWIKSDPEQWVWFHRRWRSRP